MKELTLFERACAIEFKLEDETETGMPLGKLSDASGAPIFPDGRWVTKALALKIAREHGVQLFES